MRIVVLDAHSVNPGDLSWSALEALGACEIHPRTEPSRTVQRAAGAAVVLTNKTRLGRGQLGQLPDLRYVGVLATGHDVVDVQAAAELGIVVCNVPAYGTASVAQATIAMMLELTNHVALHAQAARLGRWTQSGEFCHWEEPMTELAGRVLGIVGLGRIGRAVAHIASALGMSLIAASSQRVAPEGLEVEFVELDTLFERADVVSLHCPLADGTRGLVSEARIARMQPHALLINTARGGLVDEAALARALVAGEIGGAALDVMSVEPPPAEHPLLGAPRCLVTPHLAWATQASRRRLLSVATENVRAFLAGAPQNRVDV